MDLNFIKNIIKQILNEQFDSPEGKEKWGDISQDDLKGFANLEPFKNKFEYGAYMGKDSAILNQHLYDAASGEYDSIGFVEGIYRVLTKEIPGLKTFIVNTQHFQSKTHYLNLKKTVPIYGQNLSDEFSAQANIWVTYNTKDDDILDYQEDRLNLLVTTNVTTTRTSVSLADMPDKDKEGPAFKDVAIKMSGEEIDWKSAESQESLNNLMDRLSNLLYGSPDKEDEHFYSKLKISKNNLTVDELVNTIPQIEKNLKFFDNYVQRKYEVSIFK